MVARQVSNWFGGSLVVEAEKGERVGKWPLVKPIQNTKQ